MKVNDPIADFLTRVRNGQSAKFEVISVPASKMKIAIAHILKSEGFIENYKCIRDRKQGLLKVALKYREDGEGIIRNLRRISTPSKRVYVGSQKLPYVKNGFGTAVLSTSKGIVTDREARKLKVGGEYICSIF